MARPNSVRKRKRRPRKPRTERRDRRTETSQAARGEAERRGDADIGILLVHGIGNQKPGSLLKRMAEPCVAHLTGIAAAQGLEVSVDASGATEPDAPRHTTVELIRGSHRRRVLFVEAIWSDAFERPPRWRSLLWALRNLPAGLMLLGPDRRDAGAIDTDGVSPSQAATASGAPSIAENFMFLRLVYRAFTAILLVGVAVATVLHHRALGLGLFGFILLYLCWLRIVGHIVVAATGSAELRRMEERIKACLSWTNARSRRTMVLAHSQGGFLSHRILSDGSMERNAVQSLIAVGSGLKPITLLRELERRTVLLAAWVFVVSVGLGEAAIVQMLDGPDRQLTQASRNLLGLGGPFAAPLAALPSLEERYMNQVKALSSSPFRDALPHFAHGLGVLQVVELGLFLLGCIAFARLWRTAYPRGGSPLLRPRCRNWQEFSTYHDPVGRMYFPTLPPAAQELPVSVGGFPIGDHTAYFSSGSILPLRIANAILLQLGARAERGVCELDTHLLRLAGRRRVLRLEIFGTVLAVGLVVEMANQQPLMTAIGRLATALLALSLVLSVGFAWREGRVNRSLLRRDEGRLAGLRGDSRLDPVPLRKRVGPAAILAIIALSSFLTGIQFAGLPPAYQGPMGTFLEISLVALAFAWATGAGYHPSRLALCAFVAWGALHYVAGVRPLPHSPQLPAGYALPGLLELIVVVVLTPVAVLLQPRRHDPGAAARRPGAPGVRGRAVTERASA